MSVEHQTKSKIKAAALRLFVEKGVGETSIRDLARAAGIAEGTLYRHYATKEEMVRDLFQEHYAAFADRIERMQATQRGIAAKLRAVVHDICRLFDEEPTLYRFLLLVQHEALPRLAKGSRSPLSVVRAMIAEAIKAEEVKLKDAHLGASLVLGLLIQPALSLVHGSLKPPLSRYADDIAEACVKILTR